MQDKTRTLGGRKAFALIAAVFLMLFISILLLKMLAYSTEESTRTINDYLQEQAMLLTYAGTEDAVYTILGDNHDLNCTTGYTFSYPSDAGAAMFNVAVGIQYIWSNGFTPTGNLCTGYIDNTQAPVNQLNNNDSAGAAIINVTVSSVNGLTNIPIRQHRRTLQKL